MWVFFLSLMISTAVFAQVPDRNVVLGTGGGSYILFGDLLVDEGKNEGKNSTAKPLLYEILLNNRGDRPAARQFVSPGGRYQFINLAPGQYDLVVFLDHQEVARMRVEILAGPAQERVRQDISLAWKSTEPAKASSVSAADFYQRSESNDKLFVRAKEATDQKRYDDA